ncbi:phage pro-head protease [Salmonella enterica subsp. enterica serovar Heidelberg str. 622737-11]|nr:phage pro-head protease [Salmonella enterica subsp. enterica serovar Heidelberg str. 622737-11]
MSEREIRCYSGEVRAETHDSEPSRIIGYGSVFDSRSELIFGSFREIIRPGAFDEVLNDDVRALFNHDPNFILGRRSAGTLALTVDERGLRYDITAPETQTIRDLVLAPMQRGDINQSSFAFRVARDGEEWYQDEDGVVIREITRFSRSAGWQTCTSTCDSAIRTWGDTVAECVIDKLCPSHTVVVFAYPEGKENAQN